MMNYPVTHHLLDDVESLQLAVEGEGSFNSIVQRYRVGSWKKEMWRGKTRTAKMGYAL